jgi:hypothetical protein
VGAFKTYAADFDSVSAIEEACADASEKDQDKSYAKDFGHVFTDLQFRFLLEILVKNSVYCFHWKQ